LLEHEGEQCVLDIEIKTFNSRFFEPTCKLPGTLSAYEMDVVNRLKKTLLRGRVYCTIKISGYSTLLEKLNVSSRRVEEYLDTAAMLREKFDLKGELAVNQIITLPNVFTTERTQLPPDAINRFLGGIDEALKQVQASRQQEGASLQADLMQRFTRAGELMALIESETKKELAKKKEKVGELQERAQDGDEEARSLLGDIYAAIDKMDVHEEIVRFNAHLSAVHEHLASPNPEKGRKLDFILQELGREINTVMAKCSSYQISSSGVDVKVEMEKAREQVQNVV
jgi:uncharacterized protein (TIGR00255 family)